MDCNTVVTLLDRLLDVIQDRTASLEVAELDKPASDSPADLARHWLATESLSSVIDILTDAHADICYIQESCAGFDEVVGMHPTPWDAEKRTASEDVIAIWEYAIAERRRIVAEEFAAAVMGGNSLDGAPEQLSGPVTLQPVQP